MSQLHRWTLVASLLVLAPVSAARAVDITACGQFVSDREVGTLLVDLDCSATSAPAVQLSTGATLDLAGHAIIGSPDHAVISCTSHCKIIGGGDVSGGTECVRANPNLGKPLHLVIDGLTVHGCGRGIFGQSGKPGTQLRAKNVSATGNTGHGILVQSVRGENVSSSANGGPGVVGGFGPVNGRGFTIVGNGSGGISAARVRLHSSTVTGNGATGILAFIGAAALRDSTVTGNTGFDLLTKGLPRLVGSSTCDKSARLIELGVPPGATWGVCAMD